MPQRRYILQLEVSEQEIFYHWRYAPPASDIGGGLGAVSVGGSLHGIPFSGLQALGTGKHEVVFDETARSACGHSPSFDNQDALLLRRLRLELFAEKAGASTPQSTFCQVLLSMTPRNAKRILPLLSRRQIERLAHFARSIPAMKSDRDQNEKLAVFSNAGSTRIPDENLETIRTLLITGQIPGSDK